MADGRSNRFLRFLSRIRNLTPLRSEDQIRISQFPREQRDRREEQPRRDLDSIRVWDLHILEQEFLDRGFGGRPVPMHTSLESGLRSCGWAEIPGEGIDIGVGAFGKIRLAYLVTESGVPLEQRHLCAIKVQPKRARELMGRDWKSWWKEVTILRSCHHPHIVDYFSHFLLQQTATDGRTLVQLYILLEYASAGTLYREVMRYPERVIGEEGARFYAHHICSGLKHLHSKFILHNDLHDLNVLLKYRPDGTKSCLLCDFGLSVILADTSAEANFKKDVHSVCKLVQLMLLGENFDPRPLSTEAMQVINRVGAGMWAVPDTVHQLTQDFTWFSGPAVAPIPKPPSPLLRPDIVQSIGYQMPRPPSSSGPTLADRTKRRVQQLVAPLRSKTPSTSRLGADAFDSADQSRSRPVTTYAARYEAPLDPASSASGGTPDPGASASASGPGVGESLGSRIRRRTVEAVARLLPNRRASTDLPLHHADPGKGGQYRSRRESPQ